MEMYMATYAPAVTAAAAANMGMNGYGMGTAGMNGLSQSLNGFMN